MALDPLFATNAARVQHRADLVPRIQQRLLGSTRHDWLAKLTEATVPCGPILSVAEVFEDPHVQARQMLQSWQHPLDTQLSLVASPLKMGAPPPQQLRAPPLLGQHTHEVLADLLGYSADHIKNLYAAGTL